jgi:hypothetical protein
MSGSESDTSVSSIKSIRESFSAVPEDKKYVFKIVSGLAGVRDAKFKYTLNQGRALPLKVTLQGKKECK